MKGADREVRAHPLLVVLHGGSEIGDDLTMLTTTPHQMPGRLIALNQWPQTLPFIVVSPQLKRDPSIPVVNNQEWPATYVNEVIDYVRSQYRVDQYKIYLTGISLGGAGCWTYAAAYPTKVAALLPISGKTDVTQACAVKNIPIWAFHGESDTMVKPQFSIDMVNAIRACQPAGIYSPRLNLLYARPHEGWNEIYNGTIGYRVYDWLLKFRRNSTANKSPYVNAGGDKKIVLQATSFHLWGDYFDSDGTISTVQWTQTSGAALTLANTNTNLLKLTNLTAGTFEFQLKVTDNKGVAASDKVILEIVSTSTTPAVTGFVLMNGKTNADIGPITEGQVINKTTLGTTEINIKAIASTGTGSVRLSVNSDQHSRTPNTPGPYLIKKQTSGPEWLIQNGDYVLCATPYPQTAGRGTPGLSKCVKITVTSSAGIHAASDDIVMQQEGELLASPMEKGTPWEVNGEDPTAVDRSNVKIEVSPNPTANTLHVHGWMQEKGKSRYVIVRSDGLKMQQGVLAPEGEIKIAPPLPTGIYTLLLNTNHSTHSVKFIIE